MLQQIKNQTQLHNVYNSKNDATKAKFTQAEKEGARRWPCFSRELVAEIFFPQYIPFFPRRNTSV